MKTRTHQRRPLAWLIAATMTALFLFGCNDGNDGNASSGGGGTTQTTGSLAATTVSSTTPANGAAGVGTNTKISATFSTAISAASVTASTFTVTGPGGAAVAGAVSFDATNNIATFAPSAVLAASTIYTASLGTGIMDQTGNTLKAAYAWTFTTGTGADTTQPLVTATSPASAAVGVATNVKVTATFSKVMDASTINATTFTVIGTTGAVTGSVTYSGTTATFTPASALPANTAFTATITSGVRDIAGNALSNVQYVWTFTTAGATATTVPAVISTSPANQASGVPTNKVIAATFSEAMNASTITTATFTVTTTAGAAVAGTVNAAGNAATFTPSAGLLTSATYVATIAATVKDLGGNAMPVAFSWSFTTGSATDTTPPTVLSMVPGNAATAVPLNQAINVTFSEAMDPSTITNGTIMVTGAGTVAGTVTYYANTNVAAFMPSANLLANTIYTVTVTTAARDLAGNALASAKVWSFTTGSATGGTAAVNLKSLTTFALAAGGGLSSSNTGGQSTINGNVGLSPVATCLGDGVPCSVTDPIINGTLYAADSAGVAAAAKVDLAAAIADATSRVAGVPVSDLSGMVLQPGVYTAAAAASLASGAMLTFDAGGDANAVWIIQAGTALTLNNNAQVILANGAKAGNIFWVTSGAANLGSNVSFQGNLLAGTTISAGTGTMVAGRLLANTGQVTIIATTVTATGP